MAFTWGQFQWQCPRFVSLIRVWKMTNFKNMTTSPSGKWVNPRYCPSVISMGVNKMGITSGILRTKYHILVRAERGIIPASNQTFHDKCMMTSSNGNIFHVTGHLWGEFTGHRWIPLRLNKQLNKQSWGWWYEMPSHSLWRHCNGLTYINKVNPF